MRNDLPVTGLVVIRQDSPGTFQLSLYTESEIDIIRKLKSIVVFLTFLLSHFSSNKKKTFTGGYESIFQSQAAALLAGFRNYLIRN